MCRQDYGSGHKHCLKGWINVIFPALEPDKHFPVFYTPNKPTQAHTRAQVVLLGLISKVLEKHACNPGIGIISFNDTASRDLRITLADLAAMFNRMLEILGYDVKNAK